MQANPNVEISAGGGKHILRYYGKANPDKNEEIINKVFEFMPELAEINKRMAGR